MAYMITDLAKQNKLNLAKVLYSSGNYPNDECMLNAIEDNRINIIDWLITIKYPLKQKFLHHCICFDKFEIFKMLYKIKKFNVFCHAILEQKFTYVHWMHSIGSKIELSTLYCALTTKNKCFLDWIFSKVPFDDYLMKSLIKHCNDDELIMIIKNYELTYKLKYVHDDKLATSIISSYMKNKDNNNFLYNVLVEDNNFTYPLLLSCILYYNTKTILYLSEQSYFINDFIKILDIITYEQKRIKYNINIDFIYRFYVFFEVLHISKTFENHTILFNKYINKNISHTFYKQGKLITSKTDFSFIINTPLIHNSWDDVIDKKLCIYIDNINYAYIIQEIFNHWEYCLNSYNYGIMPHYPTNPYTNQLIEPEEIYRIVVYASMQNITLPFIVNIFIKYPNLVIETYYKFKYSNDIKETCYFLRNEFINKNLVYYGSIPDDNEGGRWKMNHIGNSNHDYCYFNNMTNLSTELAFLLFHYTSKNI